jgi:hypothetical protein
LNPRPRAFLLGHERRRHAVTIGSLAIEPWPPINTFRQALNDLGYIEGKNVRFEYRYAKGDNARFPELANELVGLNVDVVLTWSDGQKQYASVMGNSSPSGGIVDSVQF